MEARKVLLIGWDSADWCVANPLIDRGELPHLESLISRGVMGNLTSLEPMVEPSLWTSLATGQRPARHGVLGFAEVNADRSAVRPVTAASCMAPAIWKILDRHGLAAHIVGWPASQGDRLEHGSVVSDWFPAPTAAPGHDWLPPPPGTISPDPLMSELRELRVSPEEIDADMVRLFVPLAAEVNQNVDFRLHRLRIYLASALSIQAAATWLLEHQPCDFMAVYFTAMGSICREFMPNHPPQMAGLSDRHFHIYNDVVNSAYRLHDLMLGRLTALAGDGVTVMVVSQHGYRSDVLRPNPRPAKLGHLNGWVRRQGILAAVGPALHQDELIHGAGILDIAPTLLSMYGLPESTDMPGRILEQAFKGRVPDVIPSLVNSEELSAHAFLDFSADEALASLRHCQSIDYIGPFNERVYCAPNFVDLENKWALSQSLMDEGAAGEALPVLEEVYRSWPERIEFGQKLCECYLELGRQAIARQTMEATLEYLTGIAAPLLVRASFAYRVGLYLESLDYLNQAKAAGARGLDLNAPLALTLLAMRRWKDAEEVCREIIAADPPQSLAFVGLAESLLRQRRLRAASEAALMATSLNFEMAPAHFVLGMAHWRLGEVDSAARALQMAAQLSPGTPLYHRMLAILYRQSSEPDRAASHMSISQRLLAKRKAMQTSQD